MRPCRTHSFLSLAGEPVHDAVRQLAFRALLIARPRSSTAPKRAREHPAAPGSGGKSACVPKLLSPAGAIRVTFLQWAAWVQLDPHLGTNLWKPGDNCGSLADNQNPSTGRPSSPPIHHHGYPHLCGYSDLRRQALSTQPTALTTTTEQRSLRRRTKQKQAIHEVGDISRLAWSGRDDGGHRDALTWKPTPRSVRPVPSAATHRNWANPHSHYPTPVFAFVGDGRWSCLSIFRAEKGSAVERMRA